MEMIKEFFSTIGGRLRSHFIGSILVSLLAFNWDSVLFLLMDGNSVWMKIAYIGKNWQLVWPIGVGLLIGFLNPWIIVGGAYLAKLPVEKLDALQDGAKHDRAMQRLKWESIENDKKAELAKSKDDALKLIKDSDIRDSLKEETLPTKDAENSSLGSSSEMHISPEDVIETWDILSPLARSIIKRMGNKKGSLLTFVHDAELSSPVEINGQAAPNASFVEYAKTLKNLLNIGLVRNKIQHSNKVSAYELTEFGSAFYEQIP